MESIRIFGRLFSISENKNAKVTDLRNLHGGSWIWNLDWRRHLFQWEEIQLSDMMHLLQQTPCNPDVDDTWIWKNGKGGVFFVSSL